MKKKILVIALAISILTIAISGVTSAYFTDTKTATNVFTFGGVYISLTEIDNENQTVSIANSSVVDYGSLYPGRTILQKPTVTNTGDDSAYVAARLTLTNKTESTASKVASYVTEDDIVKMFTGGVIGTEHAQVKYESKNGEWIIYIIVNNAHNKGVSTVYYENMNIPSRWGNVEAQACIGMKVIVEAFATQTAGFNNAEQAITSAFSEQFSIFTPTQP